MSYITKIELVIHDIDALTTVCRKLQLSIDMKQCTVNTPKGQISCSGRIYSNSKTEEIAIIKDHDGYKLVYVSDSDCEDITDIVGKGLKKINSMYLLEAVKNAVKDIDYDYEELGDESIVAFKGDKKVSISFDADKEEISVEASGFDNLDCREETEYIRCILGNEIVSQLVPMFKEDENKQLIKKYIPLCG